MESKKIVLRDMLDVRGRPFKKVAVNANGEPKTKVRNDMNGKAIMQVPRNEHGEPVAGCMPEPVYDLETEALTKAKALPELLKLLYLTIPVAKLTRQDTIYGARMFQNINDIKNGTLELDDDIHKWVREKLQDEEIGLKIFGVDLYIIEQAVDDFERLHEKKEN